MQTFRAQRFVQGLLYAKNLHIHGTMQVASDPCTVHPKDRRAMFVGYLMNPSSLIVPTKHRHTQQVSIHHPPHEQLTYQLPNNIILIIMSSDNIYAMVDPEIFAAVQEQIERDSQVKEVLTPHHHHHHRRLDKQSRLRIVLNSVGYPRGFEDN